MPEENGRLKLTFPQITYGLGLIVVLVGGWFSIRYEMRMLSDRQAQVLDRVVAIEIVVRANLYSKAEVDKMKSDADHTHEALSARIGVLESRKANR